MVCTCASRRNREWKGKRKTTHQPQKEQQAGKMKDEVKKGALPTHMQGKETEPIPTPYARHRTGNAVSDTAVAALCPLLIFRLAWLRWCRVAQNCVPAALPPWPLQQSNPPPNISPVFRMFSTVMALGMRGISIILVLMHALPVVLLSVLGASSAQKQAVERNRPVFVCNTCRAGCGAGVTWLQPRAAASCSTGIPNTHAALRHRGTQCELPRRAWRLLTPI
eukprot:365743-Chlamydomonas_euryale.AAC.24